MSRIPRAIRTRILAAFLICIGMFSGALAYSLIQLSTMGEQLQILSQSYQPVAGVTTQLKSLSRQIEREHDDITGDGGIPTPGHSRRAKIFGESLQSNIQQGAEILVETQGWIRGDLERTAIEVMIRDLEEVDEARERYDSLFAEWSEASDDERQTAFKALDEHQEQLSVKIGELSQQVDHRIEHLGESTASAQVRAYSIGGSLALSAVLLGALLAGVALFTLRPIGELTSQVQRLAAGDYTGRVHVNSTDEMGLLAREINALASAVQQRDRILVERAEALDRLSLRLRRILDTIHAGLVVIQKGRADTVNPAATELWGLSEGAELPEALAQLTIGSHRSLRLEDRIFDLEIVAFGDDGHLLVGEEVTERIAAQERLARNERLALVGKMLAQITHEVRNPLNAMSLNAELLSEDLADSPQSEMVATITREIRRLDHLTGRYLELSRGRRAELNPVDPLELLRDVVQAEAQALQQAGVEAKVQGPGPGVVEVDTDALRRAVLNLLRNATEAGAHQVEILLKFDEHRIQIVMQDDGPGMEPVQAKRVFEPFYTTKATGTGLGLAISRQELEDVGGSLTASAKAPAGGHFILEIPYRRS